MREPPVMFRLPSHVLNNATMLAERLDTSVNIVAKLIVAREIMHVPAMLDEHDRQLANIYQFLRDLAFRNEDFIASATIDASAAEPVMAKLEDVIGAIDAVRDAAFVRPSTYIADLIRTCDERPVQKSIRF